MSVFINDTLQQRIERGEIWTQSFQLQIAMLGSSRLGIEVDSNPTALLFDVFTEAQIKVTIEEAVTITGGSILPNINMERNGSYSTSVVIKGSATRTGGSVILTSTIPGGLSGSLSQFSGDAGLILKANTDYVYSFQNESNNEADVSISYYFREL